MLTRWLPLQYRDRRVLTMAVNHQGVTLTTGSLPEPVNEHLRLVVRLETVKDRVVDVQLVRLDAPDRRWRAGKVSV